MRQSKLVSLLEASVNMLSGMIISTLLWMYVIASLFDYDVNLSSSVLLTCVFTVTSIIRSYAWRRFFENGLHVWTVDIVRKGAKLLGGR